MAVDNTTPKKQGRHLFYYYDELCGWMEKMGYAETTISSYGRQLCTFLNWLEQQHIRELEAVTQTDLETYCKDLHQQKNRLFGGALSSSYIQSHINVIRLLDKYLQLTGQKKIMKGRIPVEKELPKQREILTKKEILQLYRITANSPIGYRDKAMLSIYYGCGLRSGEGERLTPRHILYEKGLLQVLPGKNHRSRFVPMSRKVMKDLKAYETYARPVLEKGEQQALILGSFGKAMRGSSMSNRLKKLCEKAGIDKQISLHSLRHSIATHLLQGGMPLEQISRFLGHTSLDSTQIYTRIVEELEG